MYITRAKLEAPVDYDFPQIEDLKYSVGFALVFFVIHLVWLRIAPPLLEPYVKVQDNVVERKRRARRMAL